MNTSSILLFLVCCFAGGSAINQISDEKSAMVFLNQYGYLGEATTDIEGGLPANIQADHVLEDAIRHFQSFVSLPPTGNLDNATLEKMNLPRCGRPDHYTDHPDHPEGTRRKRYALQGARWKKTNLTWRIQPESITPDLPAELVKSIIVTALKLWEDASALTFREDNGTDADIQFLFAADPNHGDKRPFDGPGGVFAHAYSPGDQLAGQVHFDDAETFTDGIATGTNLLWVAAHEIGHSLGLDNSDDMDAVMHPVYQGYVPDLQLNRDDVAGIQAIYGNIDDPEQLGEIPGDCKVDITWATSTQDGSQYLCNDTHCYRMSTNVVDAGYPKLIGEEFPGLPDGPDASFYYRQSMKTYVFKGSEVWRLTNQIVDPGYPRSITMDFPEIPSNLSAAFTWHINDEIYFVKDTEYYRVTTPGGGVYSDPTNPYPRNFSDWWRGFPSTIDAAFQWRDTHTYMFAGTQYYRIHPWLSEVPVSLIPYPRETAVWWFDCVNGALPAAALSRVVLFGIALLHAIRFLH